jgi:hypothetical protein
MCQVYAFTLNSEASLDALHISQSRNFNDDYDTVTSMGSRNMNGHGRTGIVCVKSPTLPLFLFPSTKFLTTTQVICTKEKKKKNYGLNCVIETRDS